MRRGNPVCFPARLDHKSNRIAPAPGLQHSRSSTPHSHFCCGWTAAVSLHAGLLSASSSITLQLQQKAPQALNAAPRLFGSSTQQCRLPTVGNSLRAAAQKQQQLLSSRGLSTAVQCRMFQQQLLGLRAAAAPFLQQQSWQPLLQQQQQQQQHSLHTASFLRNTQDGRISSSSSSSALAGSSYPIAAAAAGVRSMATIGQLLRGARKGKPKRRDGTPALAGDADCAGRRKGGGGGC